MRTLLLRPHMKIFVRLTLVYFAIGLLSIVVFKWLLPQAYFDLYPLIGLFYWVFGVVMNATLNHSRLTHPDNLVNVFMFFRMGKLLLTILFLMIAGTFVGDKKIALAISVMANYIIYTILELYIYFLHNRRITRGEHHKK